MILADIDLWDLNYNHGGIIEPWNPDHLQPASMDLTLGNEFIANGTKHVVEDGYALAPREFILATTYEAVYVPNGYAARVEGRSSWGRKGLLVHATAGFVDPGFRGQITLELYNLSPETMRLKVGERLCQITYLQMTSCADRPYGDPRLGSHYQMQTGATPSVL